MSKVLLLDGHSLAYRAFFALPTDLATASGTVTNAVYGFTSMLIKVLADEEPDRIVAAFDTPKPTFRNEMDEDYKAQRESAPDLFAHQLPLVREVLDTLCIPVLEVEGVEADDVIATLAEQCSASGDDVIIVTGDRDSYQLVSDPHVRVLYNRRGVSDYVLYDEAGIKERTGVPPGRYVDYAALRGDTSDNLPGVPGIGEKTAAKLIGNFDDLEGIYDHLDELPPKQRENLGEYRERVLQESGDDGATAQCRSRRRRCALGRRRHVGGGLGSRRGEGAVRAARVPLAVEPARRVRGSRHRRGRTDARARHGDRPRFRHGGHPHP